MGIVTDTINKLKGSVQSIPVPTITPSKPLIDKNSQKYLDKQAKANNSTTGLIVNTILGLPEATVTVAKDIAQGTARSGGMIGMTALDKVNQGYTAVNKKLFPNSSILDTEYTPTTQMPESKVGKVIFGDKPLLTIPGAVNKTKEVLKPYIGETASKYTSAPLVIGSIALDFTGFSGEKAAVKGLGEVPESFFKFLAREMNPQVIEDTLKKVGLDLGTSKQLAPEFAKSTSVDEAKNILTNYVPPTTSPVVKNKIPFTGNETPAEILRLAETKAKPLGLSSVPSRIAGSSKPSLFPETAPTNPVSPVVKPKTEIQYVPKQDYENNKVLVQIFQDTLDNNPAKGLEKYYDPREGGLPESGVGAYQRGTNRPVTEWKARGDEISANLGFADSETARVAFDKYLQDKNNLKNLKKALNNTRVQPEVPLKSDAPTAHLKFDARTGKEIPYTAREQAIVNKSITSNTLPKELSGAKPRYGYGTKLFNLAFESDVDKSLYIVAKDVASKSDAKYVKFLQGIYPDKSIGELRGMGRDVRARIKDLAKGSKEGTLTISDQRKIQGVPSRVSGGSATAPVTEAQSLEQLQKTQPLQNEINIPEDIAQDPQLVSSYTDSIQQKILNARQAAGMFDDFMSVAPDPLEYPVQVADIRYMAKNMGLKEKAKQYKDIGNVKKQFRDIFRNTKQVFGEDFPTIDREVLQPFQQAKSDYLDMMDNEINQLKENVPFNPGSKESKYIQRYGEGNVKLDELVKEFGAQKANDIVKADLFFRAKYAEILKKVNKVESEIYPNNPEKWTPARKDYYRHFKSLSSDYSRLKNILDNPIKIDPMLAGISDATKPKSKWASFKQQRLGNKTDEDAVGGFVDYLPSASYAIHMDPQVGKFRELGEVLARSTQKTKNINNYIQNLEKFANELSGKSNDIDRVFSDVIPGGRQTLAGVTWVNNRVKANTILYNAASTIAQLYNVPQGISEAGPLASAKAIKTTMAQAFVKNPEQAKSIFLKERYWRSLDQFDVGMLNNTRKFGAWMVGALDEVGTRFIWNAQYERAIADGVKNPIKYADDMTRNLVAGRGIGEKPLMQNSKVFQIVAPFQLEMTNLWWAMEDMAKSDKSIKAKFGKFATLFLTLWLFNNGSEELTGNRIALDPVQGTLDAVADIKDGEYGKAGGRIGGEILGNMPFGSSLASIYPQYGTTILGQKLPTRKEFFGDEDPTRFGSGLLSTKALTNPVYKLLPPFGGGQLKKTIEGYQAVKEGGVKDTRGRTQFDVGGSFLKDAQAMIFGKYSGQGAQDKYQNDLTYAEATLKNMSKLPPEEKKAAMKKIITENPALADNLIKVIQKQSLGVTNKDEKLLNMGVATKERSKEVARQLNKLKTKEEKKALIAEYVKKKIITEDVAIQLPEFLTK